MSPKVIHWRLREVMEKHSIAAKALAQSLNVSQNSVSNLRKSEMPQINGERLNNLVIALNKLRKANAPLIGIDDLIEFSLSPAEMKEVGINV